MTRSAILLATWVALLLVPAAARASTTQLAVGIGALAASATDGSFAFKNALTTVRYGNATTKRVATATVPTTCAPSAATNGSVLLQCSSTSSTDAAAGLGSGSAPLVLSTRTGVAAPARGAHYRSDTYYDGIGTHWISGTYTSNGHAATTFINRDTGEIVPGGYNNARYDLDSVGTPVPLPASVSRRPGTVLAVQRGAYRLVYHYRSQSRTRIELERHGKLVKVLGSCARGCQDAALSPTTATWVTGKRISNYNLATKRTKTTTFTRSVKVEHAVKQPHQTLAAVRQHDGRFRVYRITDGSTTPPDPAASASPSPAKILVRRLGVSGGRLDMFASITGRATGTIRGTVRADGHTSPFTVDIARDGTHRAGQLTQIKLDRRIAGLSSSARTGIVTLTYAGNTRVRPDTVRLRAASGHAGLRRSTSSITAGGDLIVIGTTSRDAVGVVRVRMGYTQADGTVRFLSKNATLRRGATRSIWSVRTHLPARARQVGGELSIQYTGYLPRRIRGEQLAKQVRP